MEYRRFNIIAFCTLIFLLLFFMVLNYIIDPYGLFRKDFHTQVQVPNLHFIKLRYLIKNPSKYDSFLFGSSRVGKIDVSRIRDGKYYNMYYSEGVPEEFLYDIKFMLHNRIHIRHIIIGLDDFSYKVNPKSHLGDALRNRYGTISENLEFYYKYLCHIPTKGAIRDFIKVSIHKEKPIAFFDIFGTGMTLHKQVDEEIERNIEKHIKDKKFKKPTHYSGNRITETITALRNIKELCDTEGIKLILFIDPIHITTYLDSNVDQFNYFKKELAKVDNYFDFSGLNSITTDNYAYYETSHYRYFVGDLILARIYNDSSIAVPPDFGILISRSNLEQHLKDLRVQLSSATHAASSP